MEINTLKAMVRAAVKGAAVLLLGAGAALGQTATLTGGPSSLSFGTIPVNVASAPQSVTLTIQNNGTTAFDNPITISGNLLFSPSFAELAGDTPTNLCTTALAAGTSCTITLNTVFTPTAVGLVNGTLSLVNVTSGGSPVAVTGSVALTGTGYEPSVTVQLMGQQVTISNTSSTPLIFTFSLPSGANFAITGGTCGVSPVTLTTSSCTVTIGSTLTGTTTGTETTQLTVAATDSSGTDNVPVTGAPATIGEGSGSTGGSAGDTGLEQMIRLTAGPTTANMPDGTSVPMWGYSCGAAVATSGATCAALNRQTSGWSPVIITVPAGQDLEIELTNNLSFTPAGSSTANGIPTSIVIVGQVGGGLGQLSQRTTTMPPDHSNAQGCVTWFIANNLPGTPCSSANNQGLATPPAQANRVQSMATEVVAGTVADLIWKSPRPGTYLLESGTHPSIQVPMGLIGVLVVTTAPSGSTPGTAYPAVGALPAVSYNTEVPLEFSEIDPVQNKAVNLAVNTAGFTETKVWDGHSGQCGNPTAPVGVINTCYPPAVNYTPFYFLINGVAFSKSNGSASLFPATPQGSSSAPVSGTALVRMVNAGLRMHVPSIVGSQTQGFSGTGSSATVSGFTLIAEDGNVVPGVQSTVTTTVPAAPRVKDEVFMAAGKTFDVMVNVPASTSATALPVFARDLGLSANSSVRDAGMLAYIGINGSGLPAAGTGIFGGAQANPDTYNSLAAGQPFTVSDPSKGVIANDFNVYGVTLLTLPTKGTLSCSLPGSPTGTQSICANGTFTYTPSGTATSDNFTYCANGSVSGTTCSSGITATVTLGASTLSGNPTAISQSFTAKTASYIKIPSPGLLTGNSDPSNLPISIVTTGTAVAGLTMDTAGGFTLINPTPSTTAATTFTFNYTVQNSQGRKATGSATVTFPTPSNLQVKVLDAQAYNNCNGDSTCISGLSQITDYRWIIEEDKTFWVDPNCTTNSSATTAGCPAAVASGGTIPTFGVQFHTSTMDFVAQGCTGKLSCESGQTFLNPATGNHDPAVCDVGNGACRLDTTGNGSTWVNPSAVHLDPSKRYYISVLPGDAANPFPSYLGTPGCSTTTGAQGGVNPCGHTMSGAPIPPACNILNTTTACSATTTQAFAPVNVLVLPTPLPTGKLSVLVFEDDFPLNGEQDGGGGIDVISPLEPGLGGFNLVLWDTYGGLGDVTGQDTYDMFNQPLSNSLQGTVDPVTGLNACPISENAAVPVNAGAGPGAVPTGGVTGMIVTCPKYESDGTTLSPLAGQAVIDHLMPEKFSVQAYPGADRIARGEEWLQTNTLDGQHPHDSFIRIGEPSYFQEFGPAGYHVSIGFANPKIINDRHDVVCAGNGTPGAVGACTATITGQVDVQRLSRTPDQRLYPSGTRDALTWTQCWVSLGDPDGEDFMFTKCDANGNFTFANVPGGNWRLTIGDQWNDQIIDGLSTPANVVPGQTLNMGNIGVQQWQSNLYTRTFLDINKNGIFDGDEIGIQQIYTMIHYRDGHNSNALVTDANGVANFNETFPLFNWYVVEADSTRYKTTGIHTVYDAGGPADGSSYCGTTANGARACGTSTAYNYLANTYEAIPLPSDLHVPGAVYCAAADCGAEAAGFASGTANTSAVTNSTGRIDPPWVIGEAWSGMTSQANWIDFGKAPYAACPPACATVPTAGGSTSATTKVGENGGIYGIVAYASTRPFDDASQMIQQPWEPNVPRVTVNLYKEGYAADGVTPTLTMVDTTQSASWDDWAQGFYPSSTAGGTGSTAGQKPYMSCPGQGESTGTNADLFWFTLYDQPNYLDLYNSQHNGGTLHTLPYNSQYKCYDSMHIWNQLQPAPYDGQYSFPSSLGINSTTGKPLTTMGMTNGVASNMPGTNCTICVANPDASDSYRVGTAMLPPGKYVVEVIMPPGYEVYKEEDKNLLIGDNFIAPVTQQFAGLGGDIFIIPDQASVASMYDENGAGYNGTNYQNSTTGSGLADELSGVPGFPGYTDPVWPCVGEMRVVPDYLSEFPLAKETAPFAGATRPLCDRKEVTLTNQMAVNARFFIFTTTHIAAKYTGVITDDFTSEFDPFSPQFGEKFAPPNMAISTRDYLGNEISRVYSDHWGTYDGLTFSSWDVNPPNITGYSPTMLVQCMNDPGPITDTNSSSPTYGQLINDPLFNSAYSNFCYEEPYMPGLTTYLDTPVVPTAGFVGAGYNNPDCSYPDATPAIAEVDGDGVGPWVMAAGHTLTITAIGNTQVNNSAYSGPSATMAPFNQKTIARNYGFGACTLTAGACTNGANVTIGVNSAGTPIHAPITSWSTSSIVVTVPTGVPNCVIQQQAQYKPTGTTTAQCGQLVITAANGKQSVDTITVTIGGKQPTHIAASASIQGAIDTASPGDLIIVDPTCTTGTGTAQTTVACTTSGAKKAPGAHSEMVIMWKPVRLQGVGAVSSIINANATPAGKLLDPWRRHLNCLFGLTLQGVPYGNTTPYNPDNTTNYACPETTWKFFTATGQTVTNGTVTTGSSPQIDRQPLEAVLGWDASQNGNLAEQLQEPSLMGAFEGAGITVLAKGLNFHGVNPWSDGTENGAFPAGTTLLSGVVNNPGGAPNPVGASTGGALNVGDNNSLCHTSSSTTTNPYPSNFICNPSSIDGLSVINSSQGGGGIFVHGWAHFLQIANNRVFNNAGTLTGGISVGQGEFPTPYVAGAAAAATNAPPGSCSTGSGLVAGQHLPFCLQVQVNVHNNYITNNSSLGDELFSGTLSGGGGATFCTGNDYYKFNYNWVCGNLSSGEGGGLVHLGEIQNGDIEHNSIVFNQSQNPTIPTNGGGIMVQGAPDTDPTCGAIPDADCPPGLSDGTGHNLTINANLIQGNQAESGSGGGIRLQQVNGTEVSTFPAQPTLWNNVTITNNIIANNVAGWDGAGISLQDALNVIIRNNTIASNDSLASSGVLTQSIGTPDASAPAGNCVQNGPTGANTASCAQSAGVTSTPNSSLLTATFVGPAATITCPFSEGNGTTTGTPPNTKSTLCAGFSDPALQNNIIWQNRSFNVGITAAGTGNLNQQNLVGLFNAFTGTPAPVLPSGGTSGTCSTGVSYWDIGVRGDTGPGNHASTFALTPTYSVLDDTGYATTNKTTDPSLVSEYCNGSRVPPECTVADGCAGPTGYGVPPGIVDASTPNPLFSLTPSATVDEGNNWINVSWGPLALSNDAVTGGTNANYGGGSAFGNYALNASSTDIDYVPTTQPFPTTDFFGNPRPDAGNTTHFDVGAVEYQVAAVAVVSVTPTSLTFSNVAVGTTSAAQTLTLTNSGGANATGISETVTAPFSRPGGAAGGTCAGTLIAGTSCTINIVFAAPATPATGSTYTGTATINVTGTTVTGSPVALTGTSVPAVRAFSVSPTTLAFGNQAIGTPSGPKTLTITNTGNVALAGGTYTFGGGTPQPFSRATALQGGAGTCGATLAIGASCTYNVVFTPATGTANGTSFSRTLTVAFTGATGSGTPVTLTGTAVTPGTLTFSSATGGTLSTILGVRTLTFTTATGAATVTVTNTGAGALQISAETITNLVGTVPTLTSTTCSFTTPLAAAGTCTITITPHGAADAAALGVANNGSGTTAGNSTLGLVVP